MIYQRLGKSGLKLSKLSFGSWVTFGTQVQVHDAEKLISCAYERGVNFFDNAEVYSHGLSEEVMGNALANLKLARDTYCVSSKVFWGGDKPTQMGLHKKHVFEACHAALKRLRVDYLDLYFCHRPDVDTPTEETVRAMHDLIQQGKVLYWGTSEWSAQQITEAYQVAREWKLTPPTMEQPEYNLFNRKKVEGDYLPLFENFGLGTTIWSPLASGILTGKYNNGIPQDSRVTLPGYEWLKSRIFPEGSQEKIEKVKAFCVLAQEIKVSPAQLAIAWCAHNPNVSTVILGASKVTQLEENLAAIEALPKITPDVVKRIEAIFENKPDAPVDFKDS